MKLYLVLYIALLYSQVANAGSPAQADAAIQLFNAACVQNMGANLESLGQWAKNQKLERIDKQIEGRVLSGKPGTVWKATNQIGGYLLVFSEQSKCSIWAHELDVNQLKQKFLEIIDGVKRPGLSVEKIGDETLQAYVGRTKLLTFSVRKSSESSGFVFFVSTNPDDPEIQGRLTLSPYSNN